MEKLSEFMYKYVHPYVFGLQEYVGWVPILGDVVKTKQRAIDNLNLQQGNSVLIYCVGSGFELDSILERIGENGYVIGIDISENMLGKAQEKIDKNRWGNVRLVHADVRKYNPIEDIGDEVDAALCNFGSLDEKVLYNMINAVRRGGGIAISGPQPLKGIRKILYPITFVPEMAFGLSWNALHRFPRYREIFEKELANPKFNEETFGRYFIAASGTKK